MDKENILQEIGDLYMAAKNNDKVKAGCAIIIPKVRYAEYLTSLGLPAGSKAEFMGVPLIPSNTETDELIFIESRFADLDGLGTDGGVDMHLAVATAFRNRLTELKNNLINKLELGGIIFQNDEAFNEFARTQLIIEEHGEEDVIFYEGKEFMRIKSKFQIKPEKSND